MTGLQGFWLSIIKNFPYKPLFGDVQRFLDEQAEKEAYIHQQRMANDPEYRVYRAEVAEIKAKATKVARLIGCFITLSIFIVLATCWHDAEQQRARES
jgi:hypothetical protein